MEQPRKVLVTGANGHVGSNLVKALLEQGCRVRASVRDRGDAARTANLPLTDIELVSLDVRNEKQFIEASEGVDVLFHAAATFKYYVATQAEADEMVRDSIEGARSALLAAARNGVSRLVLTSSIVTLPMMPKGGRRVTEEDWRTDFTVPYMRGKTLAEQEAWKLAKARGVEMVAVLPGAILGPGFTRGTGTTNLIESIMLGGMRLGAPDSNMGFVDVRDAVQAHILAMQAGARGRFIVCNDQLLSYFELAHAMHRIDPSVPAPPRLIPDAVIAMGPFFDWLNHKLLGAPRTFQADMVSTARGKVWTVTNERAKRVLGWRQRVTLEQSLSDTMATLRGLRSGLLAPQAQTLKAGA
jgi:dihydroflavonol-4-reductase